MRYIIRTYLCEKCMNKIVDMFMEDDDGNNVDADGKKVKVRCPKCSAEMKKIPAGFAAVKVK